MLLQAGKLAKGLSWREGAAGDEKALARQSLPDCFNDVWFGLIAEHLPVFPRP
jgi:hypothetical protein